MEPTSRAWMRNRGTGSAEAKVGSGRKCNMGCHRYHVAEMLAQSDEKGKRREWVVW